MCCELCLCSALGFFSHGDWAELSAISDPALSDLAAQLPSIVLCDRAPSTVKAYKLAYQRWSTWARQFQLSPLPASPGHVCLYYSFLLQTARTASPIVTAASAVSWAHEKAGLEDPNQSSIAQQVLKGARRILAQPCKKKDPITSEEVKKVVRHWITPQATMADVQAVTLIVLGFASFLRWDELSRLQRHHIVVQDTHAAIFVASRKNDTLHEGHWVFVARTGSPSCPVQLLEQFFCMAQHTPDQRLFGKIGIKAKQQVLRDEPMSYSRARELLRQYLAGAGINASNYSLHSLRSGGASAAANAGIADRLFKRHGGWKSEAAKNGYVKESLSDLLSVSQALQL